MKLLFLHLFFIAFVAIASYSNTISSGFVYDDAVSVVRQPVVHYLSDMKSIWNLRPSRFISTLTFALNFQFSGLNATPYHMTNTAIHIFAGWTVYFLLQQFVTYYVKKNIQPSFLLLPLFGALLFISHPIQTESVAFITQRVSSLAGLFYLLTLLFFLKATEVSFRIHKTYVVLSLLCTTIALLTKENTYTIPLSILLLTYFFKRKFLPLIPIYFLLSFFLFCISYLRLPGIFSTGIFLTGSSRYSLPTFTMAKQNSITSLEYGATQPRVILTYLRLIFLPVGQTIDYDYPISKSFFEKSTIISIFFLSILFVLAVFIRKKAPPVSFGILFFLLTLTIESSIIPIDDVIFEHRLYLPIVGIIISVSFLIFSLYVSVIKTYVKNLPSLKKRFTKEFYLLLTLLILVLSIETFQRNRVWKNEYTLWSDAVIKSPRKARVHFNLGVSEAEMGYLSQAMSEFENTIVLDNRYVDAYHNLGALYAMKNESTRAASLYYKALEIDKKNTHVRNSLAVLLAKEGKTDDAIEEYLLILGENPTDTHALNGLGVLYLKKDQLVDAEKVLLLAIKEDPMYENAYLNLGAVSIREGKLNLAKQNYEHASKINPSNAFTYFTLGTLYSDLHETTRAKAAYEKALQLNPNLHLAVVDAIFKLQDSSTLAP